MPINRSRLLYPIAKIFSAVGNNRAIAWADQIMDAVVGTATGPSVYETLQEKLGADGVLSSGTADPIFATEDALFFYNSTSRTLFVRTATHYEPLIVEEDIVDHGTTTPVPDEDTAWIVLRTDTPKRFFLKERTGSPGSYSYSLQGPFFAGSYQIRIILSAQDSPATPTPAWNWENANFNISGGDWAQNTPNPKWFRIVECPNDTNTVRMTPNIRVGDPTAGDISYTRPNRDGNLPASVDDVQKLGDAFHDYTPPTQTPMEDESLVQTEEYDSNPGSLIGQGSNVSQDFTIKRSLRNYRANFSAPIFAEAHATVELQQSASLNAETLELQFAITDNTGTATTIAQTVTLTASTSNVLRRTIRISGNLPSTVTADGKLEVRTVSAGGAIGGVDRFRLELRSDLKSDEVVLNNHAQLGSNFDTSTIFTLNNALEQASLWPIQPLSVTRLSWPGGANGIDSDGMEVRRSFTLPRNLRTAMQYDGFTAYARIPLTTNYISGSRTDRGVDTVTLDINIFLNTSGTAILTRANIVQNATPTERIYEIQLPDDTTDIHVTVTSHASQMDAKLLITNSEIVIGQGIDASGFNRNLSDSIVSPQSLGTAVDRLNIASTGPAAQITLDNTQFDDPLHHPGGIAENLGYTGVPINPANVQAGFEKADVLFQDLDNPFISNQSLDFGGTFTNNGTVSSSTPLLSNPIDIPQELRDLGVDVTIRMRIRIDSIDSNFRGNFRLVNDANTSTYGDPETANGGGVGARSAGTFVTFQRTIAASQVPSTFRLRYTRTSSAGSAEINRSVAYMLDRPGTPTGQMGQAAQRTSVIIWRAGLTSTSRLVEPSAVTLHTLLGSNQWNQYTDLELHFDTSSAVGIGTAVRVDRAWFVSLGSTGYVYTTDDDAVLVTPVGTNQFRFQWNPHRGVGFREILGINYS